MPFNPSEPYWEPLTVIGYVAGRTSRLRLGTSVLILPYRNPVVTAKMLATLDVLSNGRLTLGAGMGWMEEEFKAIGLDTYSRRGTYSDECICIFRDASLPPAGRPRPSTHHTRHGLVDPVHRWCGHRSTQPLHRHTSPDRRDASTLPGVRDTKFPLRFPQSLDRWLAAGYGALCDRGSAAGGMSILARRWVARICRGAAAPGLTHLTSHRACRT